MIGFLAALAYNIAYGAADSAKTNRAARENEPKAQKWIAEREKVRQQHNKRVAAILARYEREDQEREARKARETEKQQEQEKQQENEQKTEKKKEQRKKSGVAGSVKVETIEIKDDAAFNALFDDLSALFTGGNQE